jgi:DNA ligase-1
MSTNIIKIFDTLYGYDVNNKIKEWNIQVQDMITHSLMTYSYGYIDGKKVECNQIINKGKNIGKKNSTSHFEQAILNASSKWNKKKSEGYSTDINIIQNKLLTNTSASKNIDKNTVTNINLEDNFENIKQINIITFPMLANDYFKHKSKLCFPCVIQPKLDGYRMIYNPSNQSCNSRQGKPFDIIKKSNLFVELKQIDNSFHLLDGELYLHGGIFEHLGILRKKKLSNDDFMKINNIEYHVYDIIDINKSYKDRFDILKSFFINNNFTKIKLVETKTINNETELKNTHNLFVNNNYEGSILRNLNGKYKCKARSSDLLKYKDFQDQEFNIIDYTFEIDTTDPSQYLIIWICQTIDNSTFNVRPKGSKEERQFLYKECQNNFDKFKNRKLHVKYFEMTENNIPRFPTTKSNTYKMYIRDLIE